MFVILPKAEVNSEHYRSRYEPFRVDSSSESGATNHVLRTQRPDRTVVNKIKLYGLATRSRIMPTRAAFLIPARFSTTYRLKSSSFISRASVACVASGRQR